MALTDLTNTKWVWNNPVDHDMPSDTYGIELLAGTAGTFYTYIVLDTDDDAITYGNNVGSTRVVNRGAWVASEDLKTMEITGGDDVTNTDFIAYLEANATQVFPAADIVIGTNTLLSVDTIKVTESNNPSNYAEFVFGNVPTTTTSIKIGGNTLTGVNQINVLGTDSTYKSFGYKEQVSTISFTIDTHTYQANSGMTWYEWCNSAYNTAELTTENTSSAWVYSDGGNYVGYVDDVSVIVKGTDIIISGKPYIMMGGAPND